MEGIVGLPAPSRAVSSGESRGRVVQSSDRVFFALLSLSAWSLISSDPDDWTVVLESWPAGVSLGHGFF